MSTPPLPTRSHKGGIPIITAPVARPSFKWRFNTPASDVSILEGSATRAFLELASGADLAPSRRQPLHGRLARPGRIGPCRCGPLPSGAAGRLKPVEDGGDRRALRIPQGV